MSENSAKQTPTVSETLVPGQLPISPVPSQVYIPDVAETSSYAAIEQAEIVQLTQQLNSAAQAMSTMSFDATAPVTVHGRISTLVFPEGSSGLMMVQAGDGLRYVFSTAGVPAMAKQGFTRLTVRPGQDVTVVGPLASASPLDGFIGARANTISAGDGQILFDHARLPQGAQ